MNPKCTPLGILILLFTFSFCLGQSIEGGLELKNWVIEQQKDPSKLDSSIIYIHQAISLFKEEGNFVEYIECQRLLANLYFNKANRSPSKEIARGYLEKADTLVIQNWDLAKQYLNRESPFERKAYIHSAFMKAFFHLKQDDFVRSTQLYNHALSIFEASDSVKFDFHDLLGFYITSGNAFLGIGDYQQAIEYYKKSQLLLNEHRLDSSLYVPIFINMGLAFSRLSAMDSSEFYYQQAGNIPKKFRLPFYQDRKREIIPHLAKALSFQHSGQRHAAYTQARLATDKLQEKDTPELKSRCYSVLGAVSVELRKWKEAEKYLALSLETNLASNYDYSSETEHNTLLSLGKLYLQQENYSLAFNTLEKALGLSRSSTESDTFQASSYTYKNRTLDVLAEIVTIFNKQSVPDSLYKVIAYLDLAQDLLKDLRRSYHSEGSKLNLARKTYPMFEEGLSIDYFLKGQNPRSSSYANAFSLMESSKAILLYEAVLERKAQKEIPELYRVKERNYKLAIDYYEKALFKANRLQKGNRDHLQSELYATQQQFKRFQDSLEQAFPQYFHNKYLIEFARIEQVQAQLSSAETFIQYFMGDSSIFILGISPQKEVFHQVRISPSLRTAIEAYIVNLHSVERIESQEASEQYVQHAHTLYQTLLAPILDKLPVPPRSLILSPDGILNFLAFDAFLVQAAPENWLFTHLAYLNNSYAISYTHSATHWLEQQKGELSNPPNSWLGIAPNFEEEQLKNDIQPHCL